MHSFCLRHQSLGCTDFTADPRSPLFLISGVLKDSTNLEKAAKEARDKLSSEEADKRRGSQSSVESKDFGEDGLLPLIMLSAAGFDGTDIIECSVIHEYQRMHPLVDTLEPVLPL
jgi:hypothetical protein